MQKALQNEHEFFMRAALKEARKALQAAEFPVGCVIVVESEIIASGSRRNSAEDNELNHAEIMTLQGYLQHGDVKKLKSATVYTTMEPCLMCYAALLLSGCRKFVYAYEDAMGGGTSIDLSCLPPLYRGMEVEITGGILRRESLALFQQFFQNPQNHYWQGSLLADYTLEQSKKEPS